MNTCEPEQEELNLSVSIENSILPTFNSALQPENSVLDYCIENKNQENDLDLICSSNQNDAVSEATQDTGLPNQLNSTDTVATQNHGAAVDLDICLSQHLPQGIITRQGNMIQFVASDFMEKIKRSSPVSQTDVSGFGSHVHSESSATAGSRMSQSSGYLLKQSPNNIPYISTSVAAELKIHARRVADSLDLMMGNIRNTLYKMSAITSGCQEAYQRSVDITCDSVDMSIKSMYALMAKCDELRDVLVPVDKLAVQIKEIKNILDLFETHMTDK